MKFSPEQDFALKAVHDWFKKGQKQVFRLFGYAGTGKTTLARYFAEHIEGEVQFAAFTGKAAQVLRSNGAKNACTIHSLIYNLQGEEEIHHKETGKTLISPSFLLNPTSRAARAGLIVIDECSMVDERLGRDLLSFGTPVLVLGDPAQLPPILGGGFFTQEKPDFLLQQIHRQAFDNPIIALSLQAREEKNLVCPNSENIRIIAKRDLTPECLLSSDQILVGSNNTRRKLNEKMRNLKGFSDLCPQVDDKLVCLRNSSKKQLLNGSLWKVTGLSNRKTQKNHLDLLVSSQEDDFDHTVKKIKLLPEVFLQPDKEIPWEKKKNYDEFDYGYALTVHKAQGSQWNRILLFDESFSFREVRWRWLYTAITRAIVKLTIVQ